MAVLHKVHTVAVAIPELTRRRAERLLEQFCEQRVSPRVRHKVHLSVGTRGNSVTIFEHRPVFKSHGIWTWSKVAQFRYDPPSDRWTLYCRDRNRRWSRDTQKQSTADFSVLLLEVDKDPTGIFWG